MLRKFLYSHKSSFTSSSKLGNSERLFWNSKKIFVVGSCPRLFPTIKTSGIFNSTRYFCINLTITVDGSGKFYPFFYDKCHFSISSLQSSSDKENIKSRRKIGKNISDRPISEGIPLDLHQAEEAFYLKLQEKKLNHNDIFDMIKLYILSYNKIEKAEKLLEDLGNYNGITTITPGCKEYTFLLNAYYRNGMNEKYRKLHSTMEKLGFTSDRKVKILHLKFLFQTGDINLANQLFREMVETGETDEFLYLTVMKFASKQLDGKNLEEYYQMLLKETPRLKIDVRHFTILLKFYAIQKNHQKFIFLYDKFRTNSMTDDFIFSIYLKYLTENDQFEKADEEFRKEFSLNNTNGRRLANDICISIMISAATKLGDFSRVKEYFNFVPEEKKKILSIYRDNFLLRKHLDDGNKEKFLSLYEEMKVSGNLDIASRGIYLKFLLYSRSFEEADKEFREMFNRKQVNEISFLTMMSSGSNYINIEEYFQMMIDNNFKPNSKHYNSLLQFYYIRKNNEKFMKLFEQMKIKGMIFSVTRNIYLKFLIGNVNEFRKANELFRKYMKDGDYDDSMFLTMISGASRNGDSKNVHEYLEMMKKVGLKPNVYHYNALLNFYCNQKNNKKFIELFEEIQKKGMINVAVKSIYLKFLLENEKFAEVDTRLNQMINDGTVNSITFETLISVATRKNLRGHVEEYQYLREKLGFETDSYANAYLMGNVYQHFGDLNEVTYYDKQIGIFLPSNLTNFDQLKLEFKEYFQKENFQSTEKLHTSISRTLRKLRERNFLWKAWDFFEFIRKDLKIEPNDHSFQEVFVILCYSGRFEEAEMIFQEILSSKRLLIKTLNVKLKYLMHFPGINAENCLEKVHEIFEHFEKYPWLQKGDLILLETIRLCLYFGYWKEALKYFDKFEVYNLKPRVESCFDILYYFKKNGLNSEYIQKPIEISREILLNTSSSSFSMQKNNDANQLRALKSLRVLMESFK